MTSFINIEPPRRRPSTSELIGQGFGQGFGGMVQEAGSRFLQGKINQMFANQERERMRPSALALTKSLGLPDSTAEVIMEHPQILPTLIDNMSPQQNPLEGLRTKPVPTPQQTPINMQENVQAASFTPPISGRPSTLVPPRQIGIPEEGYLPMMKHEEQRQQQQEPYRAQLAQQAQESAKPSEEKGAFPKVPTKESETGIGIRDLAPKPDLEKAIEDWNNTKSPKRKKEIIQNYMSADKRYEDSLSARNKDIAQDAAIRELEWKKAEAEKKTAREVSQKNVGEFIQQTRNEANTAANQRPFLEQMRAGINQMDTGLLSPDNLADLTHIDAFRTSSGEQLRGAAKEYWLSDIQGVGGKANMMLDKAIMSILPQAGKTKAANLGLVELQQMKSDLSLGKWAIMQELLPKYTDKNGVPRQDLQDEVTKRFLKYGDEVQNRTAYNIQKHVESGFTRDDYRNQTYNQAGGFKKVNDVFLTPERARYFEELTHGDKNKAIQVALKLGYKIPDINWARKNENE